MPMQVRFTNAPSLQVRVVALPGNVISVFGRQGAVVAANGDYTASQITNVPFSPLTATTVQGAINALAAGGGVTPSALTKLDDTNVTLTLGGTPLTALLQATSISVGWTSTLAIARGGTGTSTFTPFVGSPLLNSNDTNITVAWSGASATAVSGTTTLTAGWTGTLAVSRGGTGSGTWATNTIIVGGTTATATFAQVASGSSGTVLTSQGAGVAPIWVSPSASADAANPPQGRLTLTSGVAITTSNVTGATTLYYTPSAFGSYVPITTDGINFVNTAFTELSQTTADTTKSPGSVTINSNYDIFVWSDTGTLRATRGPAWSSSTVRGTGVGTTEIDFTTKFPTNKNAITNGPAANRGVLVGTVRSDASSQLRDTVAFRWVSNVYNFAQRSMFVQESSPTWTYTTNTYRQANANAANQLDWVHSVDGTLLDISVIGAARNGSVPGGVNLNVAVGIDSSATIATGTITANASTPSANITIGLLGILRTYPGLGRHTGVWLEKSLATDTTTWNGGDNSGISGVTFN